MSEYSVRPKSASLKAWHGHPTVSLGISLGNSNEYGEKLLSIVEWINGNFVVAIIDLSDTLYRWNEESSDDQSAQHAEARSRAWGDEWLAQNGDILSRLAIPYEVIRWDHWRNHPEFGAIEKHIESLYGHGGDETFRRAIDSDVEKFLLRQVRNGLRIDSSVVKRCRSFLFEELAGHTLLFRTFPDAVKAYPGDDLESAAVISTGLVAAAPIGMQNIPFVSLRVERASQSSKSLDQRNFNSSVSKTVAA
jgi:tRNA-dependent cyclodipeptide synthase